MVTYHCPLPVSLVLTQYAKRSGVQVSKATFVFLEKAKQKVRGIAFSRSDFPVSMHVIAADLPVLLAPAIEPQLFAKGNFGR